jgi:nitroimidazol reductase NimA-like FMN-containing flavoprotein (pyridoxamine 5'-phosphate oxidase superfamily)
MTGSLLNAEIDKILNSERLGRIGCYADGKTYIVPTTFAYDGKYIYGHSKEGLKIKMMRKNPKVCFEVDVMDDLANWKSVIIQGVYQELIGTAGEEAMRLFMEKLELNTAGDKSVSSHGMLQFHHDEQSIVKTVVYRILVLEKTGRYEKTLH